MLWTMRPEKQAADQKKNLSDPYLLSIACGMVSHPSFLPSSPPSFSIPQLLLLLRLLQATQRRAASRAAAAGGGGGRPQGAGNNILQFYTDDSPGLQVGPTTVLVASLSFVGIVVLLHIWGKFRM